MKSSCTIWLKSKVWGYDGSILRNRCVGRYAAFFKADRCLFGQIQVQPIKQRAIAKVFEEGHPSQISINHKFMASVRRVK